MQEKPIIFSTEMIKAILDGRKTQTRRVIRKQPKRLIDNIKRYIYLNCPYEIDQILWVRETWCFGEEPGEIWYKAYDCDVECFNDADDRKWKSPVFMPRKYTRIFLKVKNVRAERLQDIVTEDIEAEGICKAPYFYYDDEEYKDFNEEEYRDAFKELWDSINKKRGYGWDKNPWVWVIEVERIKEGVWNENQN